MRNRAIRDPASGIGQSSPSLTERAYNQLEELIVRLELAPGSFVSESLLCDRLGLGRTPVREALLRLARERLVRILPRRGVVISEIDPAAQLRLLEFRREVERFVVSDAARRADEAARATFASLANQFERAAAASDDIAFMRVDREFNALCLATSGNEFAVSAMLSMQALARRFWYQHYRDAADMPEAARLHAAVARAIASGAPDDAAGALHALLDNIESFTRVAKAD